MNRPLLLPLLALLPMLGACSSMGSGDRPTIDLEGMADAEFSALERRSVSWARLASSAVVSEGTDPADVEDVAALLEQVARDGNLVLGATGVLVARAQLEGWQGAAVLLLLSELDLYLETRGAWETFGPRTETLLNSMAAALREGAGLEPPSASWSERAARAAERVEV